MTAVMVAAVAMFIYLTRRWTVGRRRERIRLWARSLGLGPTRQLPDILVRTHTRLDVRVGFASEEGFALLLRSPNTPGAKNPNAARLWQLLGRRREVGRQSPRDVTALRPTANASSVVDLFAVGYAMPGSELLSHPSVATPDEFVLFSTADTQGGAIQEAIELARGERVASDLGVILTSEWVVVDFSAREMDEVELERAWQLAGRLSRAGNEVETR